MRCTLGVVVSLSLAAPANAQDRADLPSLQIDGERQTPEPALAPGADILLPKLTDVTIEVLATLSSETNSNGDTFPIRLAVPVMVDGVELLPAGTAGEGMVVHAKKKGGMGAAGELILTASFLDHDGQRIPLRSFKVGGDAESKINTVNNLNIASAAAFPPASIVGFFIKGGEMTIAEGSLALARTSEDVTVHVAAPAEQADPNIEQIAPADAEDTQDGQDLAEVRVEGGSE